MTCLHTTTKPTKANLDLNGVNKQFSTLNRGELQFSEAMRCLAWSARNPYTTCDSYSELQNKLSCDRIYLGGILANSCVNGNWFLDGLIAVLVMAREMAGTQRCPYVR